METKLFQSLKREIKRDYGFTKKSINFIPFENWRSKLRTYPNQFDEEYIKNLTLLRRTLKINNFLDKAREIFIGLGYQESYSQILSDKNLLYNKMESQDIGTVEIQDYMSDRYSVVRTWILPILMNLLSKNKHVEYPHRVFEQGQVTLRNNEEITDHEKIAAVTAHEKSDFTEIKQVLDCLFSNLGLEYEIEETFGTPALWTMTTMAVSISMSSIISNLRASCTTITAMAPSPT